MSPAYFLVSITLWLVRFRREAWIEYNLITNRGYKYNSPKYGIIESENVYYVGELNFDNPEIINLADKVEANTKANEILNDNLIKSAFSDNQKYSNLSESEQEAIDNLS